MDDVRGDFLGPPHGTTPAAVIANKNNCQILEYDQTFDPNILVGHCDLISRFSNFALYLCIQLVYEHTCTSFTLCLRITRPLTLKYSYVIVT